MSVQKVDRELVIVTDAFFKGVNSCCLSGQNISRKLENNTQKCVELKLFKQRCMRTYGLFNYNLTLSFSSVTSYVTYNGNLPPPPPFHIEV